MTGNFYGWIYAATNLVNNKRYVGQTTGDPKDRENAHIKSASRVMLPFARAIMKYGPENFEFQVIYCAFDKLSLDLAEDYFIIEYNTLSPNGYNLKRGGAPGKFTAEMKRRHSIVLKDALNAPGMHEKLSAAIKAALNNPATRAKLAKTTSDSWKDLEIRSKRSSGIKRALSTLTPEQIEKRSIKQKLAWERDREKRSNNIRSALANPEVRQRISSSLEVANKKPEVRERRSAASKEVNSRPGLNERRGASIRATYAIPEVKEAFLAVVRSDEHREKQRRKTVDFFADQANREAAAERSRQQFADPEKRARHKAAYDNPVTKAKLSAKNLDGEWYNNGQRNVLIKPGESIPEGFSLGMLYRGDRPVAQALGKHVRWHVNRNIVKPSCSFCAVKIAAELEAGENRIYQAAP
jgi:group I intron endonuclease